MPVKPLPTPHSAPIVGPYSHVVRAGDWLVCAGQIGVDPAAGKLVIGGTQAQVKQALNNVQAILGDAGATMQDIAKVTVFLTDMNEYATLNDAYTEAFGDHRPARSAVQVSALPAGASIEIEVWAYLPIEK